MIHIAKEHIRAMISPNQQIQAGWYTTYVKSSDPLQDQIVVEHASEPERLYTLDVLPMLGEGTILDKTSRTST